MQNGAVLAARPASYVHGAMQLDKIEEAVRCDLYIYRFEVNRYVLPLPKASFTYSGFGERKREIQRHQQLCGTTLYLATRILHGLLLASRATKRKKGYRR